MNAGDNAKFFKQTDDPGIYIELAYDCYLSGDFQSLAVFLEKAEICLRNNQIREINELNNYRQSIFLLQYLLANHNIDPLL